jgi:predicted PhzF superfamily epimerase YddE/YHI9
MLDIAREVGYSETAFLRPLTDAGGYRIRSFSPVAEVPFCGHATIASAAALADLGHGGDLRFTTQSGDVAGRVRFDDQGRPTAMLTSVAPAVTGVSTAVVAEALAALGWADSDIDPQLPPCVAYAGARHLVFGLRSRDVLAALSYDFERLRDSPTHFLARVPFPVGDVVEDPATGAGAAALGAYLRELGLVQPPASVTINQGDDMGRPSLGRHYPNRPRLVVNEKFKRVDRSGLHGTPYRSPHGLSTSTGPFSQASLVGDAAAATS